MKFLEIFIFVWFFRSLVLDLVVVVLGLGILQLVEDSERGVVGVLLVRRGDVVVRFGHKAHLLLLERPLWSDVH